MNELTTGHLSAIADGNKCAAKVFAKVPSLLLFTLLGIATSPSSASEAPACPGIVVDVTNLRNSEGAVACALFAEPEGFPRQFIRFADQIVMTKIEAEGAHCAFADIQPGTYALAVIHDENLNGELDTNFFGLPSEGYGFSGGEDASAGAPSFSAARFTYEGQRLELNISLHY